MSLLIICVDDSPKFLDPLKLDLYHSTVSSQLHNAKFARLRRPISTHMLDLISSDLYLLLYLMLLDYLWTL